MSISIADYMFEGPFFSLSEVRAVRGVYAVVCLTGRGNFLLLDAGEGEDLKRAVRENPLKECWVENCKGRVGVGVLYTPDLDGPGRKDIVEIIRRREFTPCGGEQTTDKG